MRVDCPACGETVPNSRIEQTQWIGYCASCRRGFRILPIGRSAGDLTHLEASVVKNEDPATKTLALQWRWLCVTSFLQPTHLLCTAFFAFFLWLFIWTMHKPFTRPPDTLLACAALMPFILYAAVAELVNSSTIRVSPSVLQVKHGPLPWLPGPRIDAGKIRRVIVRRRRNPYPSAPDMIFDVIAEGADEADDGQRLLGFYDLADALYVQDEIQRFLQLTPALALQFN